MIQEKLKQALAFKDEGNSFYKDKDYKKENYNVSYSK